MRQSSSTSSNKQEEYSRHVSPLFHINPGDKENPFEELVSPVSTVIDDVHVMCLEDSPSPGEEQSFSTTKQGQFRDEIYFSGFGRRKGLNLFCSSLSLPEYSDSSSVDGEELKLASSVSLLHVQQTDEGTPMKKSNLAPSRLTIGTSNSTLKSGGSSPSRVSRVTIDPGAYVDYPLDTRPSHRFPKRKTSRKLTSRIRIKRFQRNYCCWCFKGQVFNLSDDIDEFP